ncbi:hypothetical protein B0H13DRAFT_2350223 [Mycena leptocephala]|nr:hypothetical protein B0H13DRAFT_2350223 [Mycena leptocephala]
MSQRAPRILRPPSYWADFHRRRRLQRERDEIQAATTPGGFLQPGCWEHGVAYTFTRQRDMPLITVVQNSGRLLTLPTGPLDPNPPPPQRKPQAGRAPKLSPAVARAQALLDARPTPDEALLARLRAGPAPPPTTSAKRKALPNDPKDSKRMDQSLSVAPRSSRKKVDTRLLLREFPSGVYSNSDMMCRRWSITSRARFVNPTDLHFDSTPFLRAPKVQRDARRRELRAAFRYAAYFITVVLRSAAQLMLLLVLSSLFSCFVLFSMAFRCEVPIIRDPGSTGAVSKYYLVTGEDVNAGAYTSWHSADAQYKRSSSATLKGYLPNDWQDLEAAWRAGCARGEHKHKVPVATPPSPVKKPVNPPPSPVKKGGMNSPSPASSSSPRQGSVARQPQPFAPRPDTPPAPMAYAVRCDGIGDVYGDYEPARDHFLALQEQGMQPVLAVRASLTAAVAFIEEGRELSKRAHAQRARWIAQELEAHSTTPPSPSVSLEESDLSESDYSGGGAKRGR